MSNHQISNTVNNSNGVTMAHEYNAKKPPLIVNGSRLVVTKFKNTQEFNAPMPNQFTEIPEIDSNEVLDSITALLPHIITMIESVQNDIVRDTLLEHGAGCTIQLDSLSIEKCIKYMSNEAVSNRLSKESIGVWYDAEVKDYLMIAIADKLGVSDTPSASDTVRINRIIEDYKTKYCALAGSKTSYSKDVSHKLIRGLEVSGADNTRLGASFINKLKNMQEVKEDMLGL
jgi:hypothetical protein